MVQCRPFELFLTAQSSPRCSAMASQVDASLQPFVCRQQASADSCPTLPTGKSERRPAHISYWNYIPSCHTANAATGNLCGSMAETPTAPLSLRLAMQALNALHMTHPLCISPAGGSRILHSLAMCRLCVSPCNILSQPPSLLQLRASQFATTCAGSRARARTTR